MARILINKERMIKGRLTVSRQLDISKNQDVFTLKGQLATHRYFEKISRIDTARFAIHGVTVTNESYSADEFDIIYTFVANEFEIFGETHMEHNDILAKELEIYGPEPTDDDDTEE